MRNITVSASVSGDGLVISFNLDFTHKDLITFLSMCNKYVFRPLYHLVLLLFRAAVNRFGVLNEMNVRTVGLRRQEVEK